LKKILIQIYLSNTEVIAQYVSPPNLLMPPSLFVSLYLVTLVSNVATGWFSYYCALNKFEPIGAIGFFCCRLLLRAPPPIFEEVPEVEAPEENPVPPIPMPE
jgi:hypothetical protein